MNNSSLPYFLSLLVLFGAAYGGYKVWQSETTRQARTMAIDPNQAKDRAPLQEFTLDESGGRPFHSADLKGKVWAANVFYADCPNVCLRMSMAVSALTRIEELQDVRFVSITCDPENDTPQKLDEYAKLLKADRSRWFFCTGDMDYIKRVGQDILNLSVKRLTHSEHLVVVDRAGKVRGMFNLLDADEMKKACELMRQCLQEKPPTEKAAAPAEAG